MASPWGRPCHAAAGMAQRMDEAHHAAGQCCAGDGRCQRHMQPGLGIPAIFHSPLYIFADEPEGCRSMGRGEGVALQAGIRLHCVDEGIHACGRRHPGREGKRHPGIDDGHIRQEMLADELHFHAPRLIPDYGYTGGLAACACCGRDGDKRHTAATGKDICPHVLLQPAALAEDDLHTLGRIQHTAAPQSHNAIAPSLPERRRSLLHHRHSGIRGHMAEDTGKRHARLP